MKIQPRDKKILSGVLKYGLLSSEQIGNLFFKNLHHTTLMRRLRVLEKAKLILRIDSLPNNQSAWSLGAAGARFLNVEPQGRFTNRNTTLHDVTVSGVRIVLENLGLAQNFSTEMELKRLINWKPGDKEKEVLQVPDGLFTAKTKESNSEAVVALEVELHPKNHQRYRKIVRQYLAKDSIGFVWYFVKTKGIANTILGEWKKVKASSHAPVFLFSWLENTKTDNANLQVYSTKTGKWISIHELFELSSMANKQSHSPDQYIGSKTDVPLGSVAS